MIDTDTEVGNTCNLIPGLQRIQDCSQLQRRFKNTKIWPERYMQPCWGCQNQHLKNNHKISKCYTKYLNATIQIFYVFICNNNYGKVTVSKYITFGTKPYIVLSHK